MSTLIKIAELLNESIEEGEVDPNELWRLLTGVTQEELEGAAYTFNQMEDALTDGEELDFNK